MHTQAHDHTGGGAGAPTSPDGGGWDPVGGCCVWMGSGAIGFLRGSAGGSMFLSWSLHACTHISVGQDDHTSAHTRKASRKTHPCCLML